VNAGADVNARSREIAGAGMNADAALKSRGVECREARSFFCDDGFCFEQVLLEGSEGISQLRWAQGLAGILELQALGLESSQSDKAE